MNPLSILQLALQYGPTVKAIWDAAHSNGDAVSRIRQLSSPLATILENIGRDFFPQAAPALHIVGAVVAAFDPNTTKWLQGALNQLTGTTLIVDGIYGPQTKAAVMQLQTKLGLTIDGIAGQITQAAIAKLLAKA